MHHCYSHFHYYFTILSFRMLVILTGYKPGSQYLNLTVAHFTVAKTTLHYMIESTKWPLHLTTIPLQINITLLNRVKYLSLQETTMPHLYSPIQ